MTIHPGSKNPHEISVCPAFIARQLSHSLIRTQSFTPPLKASRPHVDWSRPHDVLEDCGIVFSFVSLYPQYHALSSPYYCSLIYYLVRYNPLGDSNEYL